MEQKPDEHVVMTFRDQLDKHETLTETAQYAAVCVAVEDFYIKTRELYPDDEWAFTLAIQMMTGCVMRWSGIVASFMVAWKEVKGSKNAPRYDAHQVLSDSWTKTHPLGAAMNFYDLHLALGVHVRHECEKLIKESNRLYEEKHDTTSSDAKPAADPSETAAQPGTDIQDPASGVGTPGGVE